MAIVIKMLIVAEEAEIIRRVFEEHTNGMSLRKIVIGLNGDHHHHAAPSGTRF